MSRANRLMTRVYESRVTTPLNESHDVEKAEEAVQVAQTALKTGGKKRQQILTQYGVSGNSFHAAGKTTGILEAGIYSIKSNMQGPYFEFHDMSTDEVLRFEDSRYNQVLDEISKFWGLKEKFDKLGFVHKRGVLLHGAPGTGKSCLLKLVMEDTVNKGDVVFIVKDAYTLTKGLEQFREIEPDRKVLVVFEDIDEVLNYGGERPVLELFDGDSQISNVLYLATTNYIDKLPPRMLRAGRFDRKMEVYNPPEEGRLMYLKHKLGMDEKAASLEEVAKKTDGFSFAQLRELLVSVYCLGNDMDKSIKRIKTGINESVEMSEKQLDSKLRMFQGRILS